MARKKNSEGGELQSILCQLADRIWANSKHEQGFALISSPVSLKAILDKQEDERDPSWGLLSHTLLNLIWDDDMPASNWSINVVQLPSQRGMYLQLDDYSDDQPQILSVSDNDWTPQVDRRFLQRLLKSNGAEFGTGVFGSPPNIVSTCIKSFPFLVDSFVAGFDAAGEDCWASLIENWRVWNEAYENPKDPIRIPRSVVRQAEVEVRRKHGTPKSMGAAHIHEKDVQETARRMLLQDEIDQGGGAHQFRKRSPQDRDAKAQVVARYLSKALISRS